MLTVWVDVPLKVTIVVEPGTNIPPLFIQLPLKSIFELPTPVIFAFSVPEVSIKSPVQIRLLVPVDVLTGAPRFTVTVPEFISTLYKE